MRRISEISEHSVYRPALTTGWVLDAGTNKGRFVQAIGKQFPVSVMCLEANPRLARILKDQGFRVTECALGARDGVIQFNIGTNDEASSVRLPLGSGAHLKVKDRLQVTMKSLPTIMDEESIRSFSCVKLDIEGAEIEVLTSLARTAGKMSPQWTVEFHDADDLKLCTRAEVDNAIRSMKSNGFSVLVRNWPDRTNVLFLDRPALSIGLVEWLFLKTRYQYLAVLWRKWLAARENMRRPKHIALDSQ
jgi:FkbM family methyltransferase